MADEGNPEPTNSPVQDATATTEEPVAQSSSKGKNKGKDKDKDSAANKRRCVSTACIACRKRKSKCDGNLPKCAACASVYLTECEYAPHTDHRRKGVYKKDVDSSKAKNSTLQILIQAILNAEEDDVMDLVRQIRTCDSLEELAQQIETQEKMAPDEVPDSPVYRDDPSVPQFEAELSGKMGDLMLDGSVKFIGGTSNLIWLPEEYDPNRTTGNSPGTQLGTALVRPREEAILSWTTVTDDKEVILHLINMYFCWHYAFFTTLAKQLFYRDFLTGTTSQYCSPLLVNVMLALGCHFSSRPAARADPDNSGTTGDHFFAEAKRLLYEDDEFANAKLCTIQALALMSVREAGCGRESKGWVYSGMSFRMACDLGLNVDVSPINESSRLADEDIDARRITFWGCFLFDKCWSNYLGRQPQLQLPNITVKKPDVFPHEDSEMWSPYTDSGIIQAHAQPARTRAVALQLSKLAEISGDLLASFYNPTQIDKPVSSKAELKKLSDVHTRLEAWKQALPPEMEAREGQLPQVLLMHMFFQLLYIHLYRPFLRYTRNTSPLPSHISPRKFCTQAAGAISKLFRLYKRTHGLRQICNIAIYIVHSACTIHLLNLPDKNARRDIIHGVKHLEEMGECWTAARRTLTVLYVCAEKWKTTIPDEADVVFTRVRMKWGLGGEGNAGTTGGVLANYSPQSQNLAQMAQQITSQPLQLTDLMARNIQQQQQAMMRTSIPQVHPGLTGGHMAPSPAETIDTRRSSGGLSLPPTTAADFSRNLHKVRPSTHLTQAQQDAWNSHQARMKGAVASASAAAAQSGGAGSSGQTGEAARLFGGVDSLMEETQDWFFKDQNQLAMGFENWGEPSQQDWGTLDLSFFDTDGPTALGQNAVGGGQAGGGGAGINGGETSENSPDYMGNGIGAGYGSGFEAYQSSNPVDVNGYTAQYNNGGGGNGAPGANNGYSSKPNRANGGTMGVGMGAMSNGGGGGGSLGGGTTNSAYGYKRSHLQSTSRDRPFDDDMYY